MAEFTLPALPYAFDALEPHVDAQTMQIHHGKHHQTYVTNLNNALKDHADLQGKTIEELLTGLGDLPEAVRTPVRNNGGGHYNHTLFWDIMTPGGPSAPTGALADAITAFGGLDALKAAVNDAGAKRFGSGWSWVVVGEGGKLEVLSTPNQDTPIMADYGGKTPILGVDVWEHAYYLKYQNKRPDYLAAWWNTVNWEKVAARYGK
jgi:superoxide dismutase, Fe-Mn family